MVPNLTGILSELDRVLLNAEVIQQRIDVLAGEVAADFAGETITVVAIMDSGLFFVADLLRKIDLPVFDSGMRDTQSENFAVAGGGQLPDRAVAPGCSR